MSTKLAKFMEGFSAATLLLKRAGENGFFIEFICLAASVIDGSLRIGLILQHQLDTMSSGILDDVLYQAEEDKIIPERAIYKRASRKRIINDKLYKRLEALYMKRNKVIHRYIISDMTTIEALGIAVEYERIISDVSAAIYEIESRQIELNVGIAKKASAKPGLKEIGEFADKKHGDPTLAWALRRKPPT